MSAPSLDAHLLLMINNGTANALFDVLMPALSSQGYLLVIPFLAYMIAQGINRNRADDDHYAAAALWTIAIACCAVLVAGWAEDALKIAVARVRPCREIEGIRLIVPCPSSFSMPSGHAISSFAFATPLYYLTREYIAVRWRVFPLLLAMLIAFSRIYLGVHYPSDVLAGALLGAVIALALSLAYQFVRENNRKID